MWSVSYAKAYVPPQDPVQCIFRVEAPRALRHNLVRAIALHSLSHESSPSREERSMARRTSRRSNGAATNGAAVAGHVKDMKLAREGKQRIEWADRHMPVVR